MHRTAHDITSSANTLYARLFARLAPYARKLVRRDGLLSYVIFFCFLVVLQIDKLLNECSEEKDLVNRCNAIRKIKSFIALSEASEFEEYLDVFFQWREDENEEVRRALVDLIKEIS